MDKYGVMELADAQVIKEQLLSSKAVVFPYSDNQVDCYIISLSIPTIFGVMPFGGNPASRVFVGMFGKGCGHFDKQKTHSGYFMEKLHIDTQAATALSTLWTAMWVYGE